jgi:excisionase family DNA binding protein
MAQFREVMNVREASRYLGVSRETLYKYLVQDRVPAFKLGNRWRFKKAVLDRWMEKQSQNRQPQTGRRRRKT